MIADSLRRLFEVAELATNFMVKLVLTSMHRHHLIPSCNGLMLKAEMSTSKPVRNSASSWIRHFSIALERQRRNGE
jgi:hypothetical protein